jgi:hypothetical protein
LLTARLITTRRPAGGRSGDDAAQPQVSITNITIVYWPGALTGFSFQRAAIGMFFTGAAAGSIATFLTLVTTNWTARKLMARISRRHKRT